jgi:hypothetical protein
MPHSSLAIGVGLVLTGARGASLAIGVGLVLTGTRGASGRANPPPASLRGGGTAGRISNLYVGGLPISAQPSAHSIGAGQYKDRFPDEAAALKACRASKSCEGYEHHCRAVPYIMTQVPCPSDTTMLCDEPATCAHSPALCMTTFECESESPLYDEKTNWMKDARPPSSSSSSSSLLEEMAAAPVASTVTPAATTKSVGEEASPSAASSSEKPSPAREAGDPLYTAGDVLGLPNTSPEAIEYGNKLLLKQRMLPVDSNGQGSVEEALPQMRMFKTAKDATAACNSQKKCDEAATPCEAREIRAQRVGADNSLWTWGCAGSASDAENEEGTSLMSGFNSRTGFPKYTRERVYAASDGHGYQSKGRSESGTGARSASVFPDQVSILPPPSVDHPTQLVKESLYDPEKEAKKKSLLAQR